MIDLHSRPLRSLRLSVTDRCNLRCRYCMPEDSYTWLPRADLLDFEEIVRLAAVFADLGVTKVRLTGGEPLLRQDLDVLVAKLAADRRLSDLALTTNGLLLAEQAAALQAAGLRRITVSLDTLREDRFQAITRRTGLSRVLAGLDAARAAGFRDTKLDMVVVRGVNDDETLDVLDHARAIGAELRFIEYMDVGGATRWSPEAVVSRREILARVAAARGPVEEVPALTDDDRAAPADRFRLTDGTVFGIVASTTAPFCAHCDRSRLTADGAWYLCLYARLGVDLKSPLRAGATDAELAARIRRAWTGRTDRGAQERAALPERRAWAERAELLEDPRLEMHKRGG